MWVVKVLEAVAEAVRVVVEAGATGADDLRQVAGVGLEEEAVVLGH